MLSADDREDLAGVVDVFSELAARQKARRAKFFPPARIEEPAAIEAPKPKRPIVDPRINRSVWHPIPRIAFVDAHALLDGFLHPESEGAPGRRVTSTEIRRAVCIAFDVRVSDIMSEQRRVPVLRPRQAAMFLCRELTSNTPASIAAGFGKNRTTVLNSCEQVERLLLRDADFAERLNMARALIQKQATVVA